MRESRRARARPIRKQTERPVVTTKWWETPSTAWVEEKKFISNLASDRLRRSAPVTGRQRGRAAKKRTSLGLWRLKNVTNGMPTPPSSEPVTHSLKCALLNQWDSPEVVLRKRNSQKQSSVWDTVSHRDQMKRGPLRGSRGATDAESATTRDVAM